MPVFGIGRTKDLEQELANTKQDLANASRTLHERDILANALGQSHDGKRDTYEIYGYPQKPQFSLLYQYARRSGIAGRIVFGKPNACWRDGFELYSDEESESRVLKEEVEQLSGKMFSALERADALNRIGKFSVLFVGIPDGQDTDMPVGKVMGDAIKSVYFRPFAYDGVEIYAFDENPMSPRYGLPELYQLQVMGRGDNSKDRVRKTIIAHWTRVIHICEERLDSEIEGIPALEANINRVLDIEKATGGSSEAYFRNARGKFSFEIDPEFATGLIANKKAKNDFDEAAKSFTNNWQDQILSIGAKTSSHSTPHASPIDTVRVSLWDISAKEKTPIRLLTGEGAGQLAGSEDKLAYNQVIRDRQDLFCSGIVRTLLDILGNAGVIKLPAQYWIEWPVQEAATEKEKADIGLTKAQTINQIASALSTVGGDAMDAESIMLAIGLEDIDVEDVELEEGPGEEFNVDPEASDQDN